MPLVSKFRGKQTVDSRSMNLRGKVFQQMKPYFDKAKLKNFPDNLTLQGFKQEQRLEVWTEVNSRPVLIKRYPFTASSGGLGPKLKEGDRQIPEGCYKLEYLNPNSAYYLSMKIDYPNAFDQKMAIQDKRTKLGNDIFIHGKASTIGCIPIGDAAIEELFIMVSEAGISRVEVIISPWDFRTNPEEPEIDGIEWEKELYSQIKAKLLKELR